jgi:hypothetical protein
MRRLALAAALILPFAQSPAFAEGVILTGPEGGTIEKTRDCVRAEGSATCEVNTIFTSVDGQVATKLRLRTTVAGSSTMKVTLTGPEGETRTRERTFTRGN